MITESTQSSFDDHDFELRIEELLRRRAEEVDLSGLPSSSRPTRKVSVPTRIQYLAACAALTLVVSSAFFLQFGRSSDETPNSDAADAIDNELPGPTPVDETEPVEDGSTIETVDVRGITINAKVADQLDALLTAAEAEGLELSGQGYRSSAEQVELRKRNCGTSNYDIYEKPAEECSPPTAIPGTSLHEQGLAVDFTVDNKVILSRTDPAYEWLSVNAPSYGMEGQEGEPWHWEFVDYDDVDAAEVGDGSPPAEQVPDPPEPLPPIEDIPGARERLALIAEEDLRTINGMTVHVDIAEQLQAMVDDAKEDGIELNGHGYRSPETQEIGSRPRSTTVPHFPATGAVFLMVR